MSYSTGRPEGSDQGCARVGVFFGTRDRYPVANRENFAEMFRWFEEGKLKPLVSTTMDLSRVAEAFNPTIQTK